MSVQTEQCPKLECPSAIPLHHPFPIVPRDNKSFRPSHPSIQKFSVSLDLVLPLCCVMAERQETLVGEPVPKLGHPLIISAPAQGRHESESAEHQG